MGEHSLPKVSSYSYLGIDFSSNEAWDMHIKNLLDNGRKTVNQLHKVISNRKVNLSARRLLLLSVIRPNVYSRSDDPRKLRVGVKYYVVHSFIHQNHILRLQVCTHTVRANCAQKCTRLLLLCCCLLCIFFHGGQANPIQTI